MRTPSLARIALAALTALAACGGKTKSAELAPLPDDPKPAEEAKAPAPGEKKEPAEPPAPPAPTGPLEVTIPAQQTTVKLISKGKGKLAPLRYAGKAGQKQPLELALDFASTETLDGKTDDKVMPTIVLVGEAETKAIDKDGKTDYALTISSTDVRDVQGSQIQATELKPVVASLAGMVIGGSVGANGTSSDVSMRIEKSDRMSAGALDMVRLTLPVLPMLPAEPVGVGAKWQTTTTTTLSGKFVVTHVTNYELVASKGGTWSIKGKTAVTGADQELPDVKISKISGTGTTEMTLAAGALYPTYKTSLETRFNASQQDTSVALALRIAGSVTAK